MNKILFFSLSLTLLLFGIGCGTKQTMADKAFVEAQKVYAAAVEQGQDLSAGPCLSNGLYEGVSPEEQWVVDVAHNPRTEQDSLPINQCSAFLKGEAKHFIEFDKDGNLIKFF